MTELLAVCVPAALVAVGLNATAAVLQARVTKQAPARAALALTLLADLVRRPMWLLGTSAAVVAFLFQALALMFGPVVLVQPILVGSLLVTVLLRALLTRRPPSAATVAGAVLCAGGLAAFLALARPSQGALGVTSGNVLPLAPVLGALLAGGLLVAMRRRGNARAVPLALAAGILYGVTAGMTELVTRQLGVGVLEPLRHWELYAAVACGLFGVQLNQSAFQVGTVPAAVAVITATDPLVSIAIGIWWLGERVATTPGALAAEVVGLVAMITGIALLARESP